MVCPYCDEIDAQKRGTNESGTKQRYKCCNCDRWFMRGLEEFVSESEEDWGCITKQEGNKGEITTRTNRRITTLDELVQYCEIDTVYWEVERWVCNKWEVGAKDKNKVLQVEPLFQVKVWLRKRIAEIQAKIDVSELISDAQKFAPQYPKIKYTQPKSMMLYEVDLPDLQLGRLVMEEEAGRESNPDIYVEYVGKAIDALISRCTFDVDKILLPIGNDFFDSNTAAGMTAHGTPQRDDVRWQRTFRIGRELMVRTIDKLSLLAPVDVMIIPGNHDEERIFYLGDSLESWYHNSVDVNIDNRTAKRKYYSFGKCLIGFTHGYFEKIESLAALMSYEVPELWGKSLYREFHLGDKHHKKDMIIKTQEMTNGVVVRILRSLAPPSVWEYDKGFVGSQKAAESFVWSADDGVIAQYTATTFK